MKLDLITKKQDEFYTPAYAISPLLKYVDPAWRVLCPFDTAESRFVRMLREHGCFVEHSHLGDGVDFFSLPRPSDIQCVISNPPYSMKGEVLDRLFDWGIPFAMLVGVVGLFESQKRFEMFRRNRFEIMYLNRRVAYFRSYETEKPDLNPPFSSVYLTSGVLPQQVVFEEIVKT